MFVFSINKASVFWQGEGDALLVGKHQLSLIFENLHVRVKGFLLSLSRIQTNVQHYLMKF